MFQFWCSFNWLHQFLKMGIIYKITSPSAKVYIGKTYDLRKRINCHKHASKKDGTNIILHNSIKKYGWENHLLEILEEVDDATLNEREIFWIRQLKTYCYENPFGLNMTVGGDGQRSTWMHDTKRRAAMSERFRGEKNPFYGKTPSAEVRKIISEKATKRHLERGTRVPQWGVDKGREKCSKKVVAYDLKGKFIAAFKSCGIAASFFGMHHQDISTVARGEQQHSHKMIFRFYDETYPQAIDVSGIVFKRNVSEILLVNKKGEVIKEFVQADVAAKELGIPAVSIRRVAGQNKGKALRSGHIFFYKDQLSNQFN